MSDAPAAPAPTGEAVDGPFVLGDAAAILAHAPDWNRLAAAVPVYVPSLDDAGPLLADPAVAVRLAGVRTGGEVTCLMLFVIRRCPRGYWLGPRRLFSLSLRTAQLFGPAALGTASAAEIAALIERVEAAGGVDLFTFDDLAAAGPLYPALVAGAVAGPRRASRHNATRRLIDLPATMAGYWAALRSNTRKTAQRDRRYFDQLEPSYALYTGADAIETFLPAAAALSARTYQQGMGFGLVDGPAQRASFARLAAAGRLRCYLALVGGEPIAFAWGDVSHGIFYFRMTGYDPDFGRHQAGKGMLFHVIEELIDSRAAHSFDFGVRDMAYKERFSTRHVDAVHLLLGRWHRPRGLAAIAADRGLDAVKALVQRSVSGDRLLQWRRRLQRMGGTA